MDQELKTKWLEALRSGQYTQGYGFLFNNGAYCCLGVLNVCAGRSVSEIDGLAIGDSDSLIFPDGGGPRDEDSDPVMTLMRISDPVMTLMRMNDGGSSFPEIADWIEKNVE